jgi:hypothetical protein
MVLGRQNFNPFDDTIAPMDIAPNDLASMSIAGAMARLALGALQTQMVLDDDAAERTAAFTRAVAELRLDPEHPLLRQLAPKRLRVTRQRFKLGWTLTARRSLIAQAEVRLGLNVTSGVRHVLFESTRTKRYTLAVEVVNQPRAPADSQHRP